MAMTKKLIVILFCIPVLFLMGSTEKASTEECNANQFDDQKYCKGLD